MMNEKFTVAVEEITPEYYQFSLRARGKRKPLICGCDSTVDSILTSVTGQMESVLNGLPKPSAYEVLLHTDRRDIEGWDGAKVQTIYQGTSEAVMYSHVSAVELALMATYDGAVDIEIIQDGHSRWLEYRDGKRVDI
jgi:hypothetical protein